MLIIGSFLKNMYTLRRKYANGDNVPWSQGSFIHCNVAISCRPSALRTVIGIGPLSSDRDVMVSSTCLASSN